MYEITPGHHQMGEILPLLEPWSPPQIQPSSSDLPVGLPHTRTTARHHGHEAEHEVSAVLGCVGLGFPSAWGDSGLESWHSCLCCQPPGPGKHHDTQEELTGVLGEMVVTKKSFSFV